MKKLLNIKSRFSSIKGFTLIELLIVIAILGILAAVILVAIDPVEQLAKGRDAGRKNAVSQLGRAITIYYTSKLAYPPIASWNTDLVASGEFKNFPGAQTPALLVGPLACASGNVANTTYCYKLDTTVPENPRYVVYTKMDSRAERSKGVCGQSFANTWYIYASSEGQSGIYCNATEPTPLTAFGGALLP